MYKYVSSCCAISIKHLMNKINILQKVRIIFSTRLYQFGDCLTQKSESQSKLDSLHSPRWGYLKHKLFVLGVFSHHGIYRQMAIAYFWALEQWRQVCHFNVIKTFRRPSHMQTNKCLNTHAVVEQRVPVPRLYTIITARRPWPVGNSRRNNSETLLMVPLSLLSKHKLTQNINGKHYNGRHMRERTKQKYF